MNYHVKQYLADLSIASGSAPAFEEPIHVGRPNIGDREALMRRINDLLDRRWLSNNGPFVQEFETRLCRMFGVKHCIPMCNGTVALEIAIRALEMKGEVIVPSFTFVATAHALQWQEITPVFCDIDPRTHNIDPCQVERMITPRTTGIIGVHVWGRPCDTGALAEIASRRKLRLMYDASHALGCSREGVMAGNFGDVEVFSFHATKFLNTFEGGAIATNDDDLAKKIRLMKNFGFAGYDNVVYLGTNGKLPEISAAMGLTGLDNFDQFVSTNRRNYEVYARELAGIPGLQLITYDASEKCNWQYIIATLDEEEAGVRRDALIQMLHAENVIARRYFYPGCHRMEPYRSLFPHAGLLLSETERIAAQILVLPTGTAIGPDEISTICRLIQVGVKNGRDLNAIFHPANANAGLVRSA